MLKVYKDKWMDIIWTDKLIVKRLVCLISIICLTIAIGWFYNTILNSVFAASNEYYFLSYSGDYWRDYNYLSACTPFVAIGSIVILAYIWDLAKTNTILHKITKWGIMIIATLVFANSVTSTFIQKQIEYNQMTNLQLTDLDYSIIRSKGLVLTTTLFIFSLLWYIIQYFLFRNLSQYMKGKRNNNNTGIKR